jgi:hypothetical protein
MKPRRTKHTAAEKVLLRKLQRSTWTTAELVWLLVHLRADTPTRLVQHLHSQLIELRESGQAT